MDTSISKYCENSKTPSLFDALKQFSFLREQSGSLSICLSLDCKNDAPITIDDTLLYLINNGKIPINCIHAPTGKEEIYSILQDNPNAVFITTEQNHFDQYNKTRPSLYIDPSDASILKSSEDFNFSVSLPSSQTMNSSSHRYNQQEHSTRTFYTSGSTRFKPDPLRFLFHEHLYTKKEKQTPALSLSKSSPKEDERNSHSLCQTDFDWFARSLMSSTKKEVASITVANTFPLNFDASLYTREIFKAICHLSPQKKHIYRHFSYDEVQRTPQIIAELMIEKINAQAKALSSNEALPLFALNLSPHVLSIVVKELDQKAKTDTQFKLDCSTFFGSIFTTGTSCDSDDIKILFDLCPHVIMLNGYGPTEVVYGLPPKAYCNIISLREIYPGFNEERDTSLKRYCSSSAYWPRESLQHDNNKGMLDWRSQLKPSSLKPYQILFAQAVLNLVPHNRPSHSVCKGKHLNKVLSNPTEKSGENDFEVIIKVHPEHFTHEESKMRSAPLDFDTGDICRWEDDNVMAWRQRIQFAKGPNNAKIVVKNYTEYLQGCLSEAYYQINDCIEDMCERVYCAPAQGLGMHTFLIDDCDVPFTPEILNLFLLLARKEANPCPEEIYIVPRSEMPNQKKLTHTGKQLTNELGIKLSLVKELSDLGIDYNRKIASTNSNPGIDRFTPGLHRLTGNRLPKKWNALYLPIDIKKSQILAIIRSTISDVAGHIPSEMSSGNGLLPDVSLTALGFDSHNLIAFRSKLIHHLNFILGSDIGDTPTSISYNPPRSFKNNVGSQNNAEALLDSILTNNVLGMKTITEISEIIAEILLINPIHFNKKSSNGENHRCSYSNTNSCFHLKLVNPQTQLLSASNVTINSQIAHNIKAKVVVIAIADITGGDSPWWSSPDNGLFHKIISDLRNDTNLNALTSYTLSVPPLLTSNVETIKSALLEVCSAVFNQHENAHFIVTGFSSGGTTALLLDEVFPNKIHKIALLDPTNPKAVFPIHPLNKDSNQFSKVILQARTNFIDTLTAITEHCGKSNGFDTTINSILEFSIPSEFNTSSVNTDEITQYWKKIIELASKALPEQESFRIQSLWEFFLALSNNNHRFITETENGRKKTQLYVAKTTSNSLSSILEARTLSTLGFHPDTPEHSINHGIVHQQVPESDQVSKDFINTIRAMLRPFSPPRSLPLPYHSNSLFSRGAEMTLNNDPSFLSNKRKQDSEEVDESSTSISDEKRLKIWSI